MTPSTAHERTTGDAPPTVRVTQVDWATHQDTLQDLRRVVFIEEQNVPQEEEWDGQDEVSVHFIAECATDTGTWLPCGTSRLLPTGQIGRMAVLREYRQLGIGRQLLDAAVAAGRAHGHYRLFLHAQTHALGFYADAGFIAVGPFFQDAGIEHQEMEQEFPIEFVASAPLPATTAAEQSDLPTIPRPGQAKGIAERAAIALPDGVTRISSADSCATHALAVVSQARRHLRLQHDTLDPVVSATAEFVTAVNEFLRSAPAAKLEILVLDPKSIAARGHPLLRLAHRMSASLQIRIADIDAAPKDQALLMADLSTMLLLVNAPGYQGFVTPDDPLQCKRFAEQFDTQWQRARDHPDLRRLSL